MPELHAEGVITRSSPYDFSQTVRRIWNTIASQDLSIFTTYDHHLRSNSEIGERPAEVIVFDDPRTQAATVREHPLVALDLPLRLLVWEDHDHHVWVSYTDPDVLIERYELPIDLRSGLDAPARVATEAVKK